MHIRHFRRLLITFVVFCSVSITTPASANITCKINFKLSGWSFVYKQYDGSGAVRCSNGQQAQVKLASKGGGFTIGVSEIEGTGVFSELKDIREIYGTFVSLEGHAGAVKSAAGQVLTKGVVSLAMSGEGRGFDIGVAIGGLTISPIR